MNYGIAWILSASAFLIRGSQAKLTVVPKNVAVVEGDVAIMNCTTNNDGKLIWITIKETQAYAPLVTIYTGNKFAKNYSDFCEIINSTKGQFILKVRTRKDIPLHYVCDEAGVENSGADLVVLESNPDCAVVDDGRDLHSSLQMRCSVHFVGNWIPVMEWKMISTAGKESTVDINSINTTSTTNVVNSTINITAHSSLDGCKYTCTTRFTEFSRSPKYYAEQFVGRITWPVANNVPEYSSTWISQTLYIVTESNVPWIKLDKDSSMSRSVPAIIIPIIVAMCVVGGVFLLIRFTTRRQKMSTQNLTSNTDDRPTLTAEYVELDEATTRAAEDDIRVLPIYEQINDGSERFVSGASCPNESPSFTQGEYAHLADRQTLPSPIYTSLLTTSEQL